MKKRLKDNKAINYQPENEDDPKEQEFREAFNSINSDEPLSLGDFLQALNERLKQPKGLQNE